ncbi:flagellar filament capping protein FliD [Oxalobacteraceae bacterium R-40]|uniref:Flagellar hook-associated protein 2 n=1 Tax=Keguizhuia sedimenti TaxID=3064264 RepID=A0ABU1BP77_9BURK|nr:flagellar filament capping protein FliD [Oxalobacteraceae bacterium R-40]
MALSSPGIGSNLDINGIISQLMTVEQQPLVRLSKQEASYQAKLSAFGSLKGALASFQTTVNALSDISKFQAVKASAADSAVATVSAGTAAVPGSYSLEVSKLAQAQKLASAGQASTSAAIGTGTITFDFGTISGGTFDAASGKYTGASFTSNGSGTKTVTIDTSNHSLTGIRDAINKANIGVTASIVNDGGTSPYRLVLTEASTGKSNSVKISVSGSADLQALLNHDPGAAPASQAFTETVTAQNAEFKIDGIAVSKTGNSISDVIEGITLNLAKTNAGTPTQITVARDTSSVSASVSQFVTAYNQINKTLKDLSAYNADTKQGAILNGDATVRAIQTQVRGLLTNAVEGGAGSYSQLFQIGVSAQKDGTLALDSSKLQKAMDSNFSDVAALFAAVGKSSDSLVSYSSAGAKTKAGAYELNVTRLATQGKVSGGSVAGLVIDTTNDTLDIKIDGISASIKLNQTTYASAAALAAEVQSKINGASALSGAGISVTVTESGGKLAITSNRYGSASNVTVSGGNGKDNLLGLSPVTTEADGVDVAGTINGVAATGSGQSLSGAAGSSAEGLKLQITGGVTGNRGTVNFSRGYADQFNTLIDSLLGTTGPLSSRTDGLNASIKSITQQKQRISNQLVNIEKRYRAQFTALDVALANMTKTSAYLQQQLANLPRIE